MSDEIEGLTEFLNVINGLEDTIDTGVTMILEDTADDIIDNTKRRTNRITGKLQDSWKRDEVKKDENGYSIELGSDCEYAKFVEEGHKQEVGRYVPAIGKKLKKPFVEGKWMLKDSVTEEEENFKRKVDSIFDNIF